MNMSADKPLKAGTRKSMLALAQTDLVRSVLNGHGASVEVVEIVTSGDKKQTAGEEVARDKKDWIAEIEMALLERQIDFAVHSAKDVPVNIAEETTLLPVLGRASAYDVLICTAVVSSAGKLDAKTALGELKSAAVVGTASARRGAQLLRLRPDLTLKPLRGNVTTRVEKLRDGSELDAAVLACAGLERLALAQDLISPFAPADLLPAVNQGILTVQFRKDDSNVAVLLSKLVDQPTRLAWEAERSCIEALGADCGSAVGVYAELSGDQLRIAARVLSPDGSICLDAVTTGNSANAGNLGQELAEELLKQGAQELL